ncbi:MAG: hypothetical protein ACTHOJ_08165 [Sphingomonas oligoaromativorans]|nr:hypothetical protein [Sphingomonas oligoaromativorans]
MKIVVIGGTGLIGSKIVAIPRTRWHDSGRQKRWNSFPRSATG